MPGQGGASEAGEALGTAFGQTVGSKFGPSGEWAAGTVFGEVGSKVGAAADALGVSDALATFADGVVHGFPMGPDWMSETTPDGAVGSGGGDNMSHDPGMSSSGDNMSHDPGMSSSGDNASHDPRMSSGGDNASHDPGMSSSGDNMSHDPRMSSGGDNMSHDPGMSSSGDNMSHDPGMSGGEYDFLGQ